jgi:hypothetical protein
MKLNRFRPLLSVISVSTLLFASACSCPCKSARAQIDNSGSTSVDEFKRSTIDHERRSTVGSDQSKSIAEGTAPTTWGKVSLREQRPVLRNV